MNHQMTGTSHVRRWKGAMLPTSLRMNIHGDMVEHKPVVKPAHWADPVVTFSNGQTGNGHIHSDRLWEADYDQYNKVSQKLFGDQSQLWWDSRTPAQVEAFLRAYYRKPKLVLVEIQKMYNRSNGFPVWGFSYRIPQRKATRRLPA
jgi:hypothetical protein